MDLSNMQIPGQYLYVLSECMDDFGIEPARWLSDSNIDALDASYAESSVGFPAFRELALKAARVSNNPALGLSIGQRLSLPSHGILGYALMNCGSLRDAAILIENYIAIRLPLVQPSSMEQGNEFTVIFKEKAPLNEVREIVFDALLLTVKNALDHILPLSRDNLTICFPTPAHPGFPYKSVFGCQLRFDQPFASLHLPQHLMDQPIAHANAAAYQEAESLCRQELARLSSEHSYTARIQKKLLEQPGQFPKLDVVAAWFNITPRTLHRRLIAESSSYKTILEEIKLSLALSYLSSGDMPIKEIAYFLGYEEIANFRRAFKRWKGMTPSSYRDLTKGNS